MSNNYDKDTQEELEAGPESSLEHDVQGSDVQERDEETEAKKSSYYILDDNGEVRGVDNVLDWAMWFEASREKRRVAFTELEELHVSTVFLALDHNFPGDGPPILWETMVFEKKETEVDLFGRKLMIHRSLDDYSERYSSREEAVAGHNAIVEKLKGLGYK